MTDPDRRERAPLFRRAWFWLSLLGVALVAALIVWFASPPIYRQMIRTWFGVDDNAVRLEVRGRVLDADGQIAPGAVVIGSWEVFAPGLDGPQGHGMFSARADDEGRYWHMGSFSTDQLEEIDGVELRLTMQAHGRFHDVAPSEPISSKLSGRAVVETGFQLGRPLPTVPVRVTDSSGAPVETFWVFALPAEGKREPDERWPSRWKDFPGGVAPLTIPSEPFRVKVHLYRGAREVIVGPFDPDDLPARIDVTLPDR